MFASQIGYELGVSMHDLPGQAKIDVTDMLFYALHCGKHQCLEGQCAFRSKG